MAEPFRIGILKSGVMANSSEGRFNLMWADKTASCFALLFGVVAAIIWGFAILTTGFAGADHISESLGFGGLVDVALLLVALWLAMRIMNFAVRVVARNISSRSHSLTSVNPTDPAQKSWSAFRVHEGII